MFNVEVHALYENLPRYLQEQRQNFSLVPGARVWSFLGQQFIGKVLGVVVRAGDLHLEIESGDERVYVKLVCDENYDELFAPVFLLAKDSTDRWVFINEPVEFEFNREKLIGRVVGATFYPQRNDTVVHRMIGHGNPGIHSREEVACPFSERVFVLQ